MVVQKRLAFFCICFLSACNYPNTDDLAINPYSTGSASNQVDPNCEDNYERPSGSGYLSNERARWMQHVADCKSRGQGRKLSY